MEEPPPLPESASHPPEGPQPPRTSLPARLLNVFAVPGEVFCEVKASAASAANWLVPVLLLAISGAVSAVIIFSQPAIQQQIREQQSKVLDKQVQAGKMTREQADQAIGMIEKFTGPTMLKIFGGVAAVMTSFVRVFWWALVLWLFGKWFLKAQFDYAKTLEVAGLALMISMLGTIVTVLLTVNLARMFATPSLALAVHDFDATRKSHLFLGAANVFSVWQVGVFAAGLARLANVPFLRAAFLIFAYWFMQESFFILSGLGQFAL